MAKRIKKTMVPPREERITAIGDPKTPKMGSITPTKVHVPEVGDLLDKIEKAVAPREVFMPPYRFTSFDLGTEVEYNRCTANCNCPPCRRGACAACLVDAQRNADRLTVRSFVAEYRGIKLP
jgi:hypothetical protein